MNIKTEYRLEYIPSVLIGVLTLGIWFVWYNTYRYMTGKDYNSKKLVKIPYSKFKTLFENIEWKTDPNYPSSLFPTVWRKSYWHADILQIGDTGYILTLYGYVMQLFLKHKIIKRIGVDNKVIGFYNGK